MDWIIHALKSHGKEVNYMERFFGELIAIRLMLGRILANQAHNAGDPQKYIDEQLRQAIQDLEQIKLDVKDENQEKAIRVIAESTLADITSRIHFAS
ncbi:MAG: hypothetical protein HOI80_02615 [Alphaproteobacteria bacterium]|nr:hypothetical protein [Alphaproteobacteria bacterium]MBT5654377.1 hypothetical protein [Alphaproteobacteria bacterium]